MILILLLFSFLGGCSRVVEGAATMYPCLMSDPDVFKFYKFEYVVSPQCLEQLRVIFSPGVQNQMCELLTATYNSSPQYNNECPQGRGCNINIMNKHSPHPPPHSLDLCAANKICHSLGFGNALYGVFHIFERSEFFFLDLKGLPLTIACHTDECSLDLLANSYVDMLDTGKRTFDYNLVAQDCAPPDATRYTFGFVVGGVVALLLAIFFYYVCYRKRSQVSGEIPYHSFFFT